CALFGAFIAAAIAFVAPADALQVAKQVLVWLTLALVLGTFVYGVVHGLVYSRGHSPSSKLGLSPQTDLAILNWRREKSVFLGASQPPEDASWIFQLRMAELGTTPGKWLFGVYLQFSISDAYALRDAKSQIKRGFRRAFRVWWSGIGCGIVPLAAVLVAYAYEKVARDQETEWDFAEDCLVTHGPSGTLNMATGL